MAVDMFMKIDDIKGESVDEYYEGWIECFNYEHGVSQPVSGTSATGGRSGGRAHFEEFTISKYIDVSTPDLNIYCASGKHIPKIELVIRQRSGDRLPFMKYIMEDVLVSSASSAGSDTKDLPVESISFTYAKIKWEYTPYDRMGSAGSEVGRTWNLELNKQE